MNYTLENILSEANLIAQSQDDNMINTIKQSSLMMVDPDVKELINYILDNEIEYTTYSHT